jgi:COP9 signalosome complex subunit 7
MQEDFAAVQRIDALPSTSAIPSSSKQTTAPTSRTFVGPAKLEPFLLLAKSARGAGAAALIDQVTAAPGVFVFGELTESRAIAEVRGL